MDMWILLLFGVTIWVELLVVGLICDGLAFYVTVWVVWLFDISIWGCDALICQVCELLVVVNVIELIILVA